MYFFALIDVLFTRLSFHCFHQTTMLEIRHYYHPPLGVLKLQYKMQFIIHLFPLQNLTSDKKNTLTQ